MVNDVATVRIPGITAGGAIQISNAAIVTTVLGAIAISLLGSHFMNGMKNAKWKKKHKMRTNPRAIENKIVKDVMAFSTNIETTAHHLPQIRNLTHTMKDRIKDQIRAYRAGEITQTQFDNNIRNMYQMVQTEMGIPANTIPQHVTQKIDASIDRIADRMLEGKIPVKIKYRMYKTNPGLSQLHALGRQRALEMGQGHKYGLKNKMAMHTSAGVYLKDVGWNRDNFPGKGKMWGHKRDDPNFPGAHYGSWFRM